MLLSKDCVSITVPGECPICYRMLMQIFAAWFYYMNYYLVLEFNAQLKALKEVSGELLPVSTHLVIACV